MKKHARTMILGAGLSLLIIGPGSAQVDKIGDILTGGVNDAQLILTEYLRPLANSLGANLNGGWYNTAKVHGTLGFHLTFTLSASFAPDEAKMFDLTKLALGNNVTPSSAMAPTFSGEKGSGPTLSYQQTVPGLPNPVTFLEYDLPGGTGLGFLPSPMINAGVGLPKGFEIMARYMPRLHYGGLSTGLWGLGFKHDIGQWIPFVKRLPVLDFTIMYGYTNLNANAELTPITPDDLYSPQFQITDNTSGISWDDQNLDLTTQGHTANFLVGATLPVVAFYGGVGISITKTNLKANGYYPLPTLNVDNPLSPFPEVTNESALKDPIDIEIKNSDGSTAKPRFNVGMRFKFTVITIHFDYTYANYSVATAGLGISLR